MIAGAQVRGARITSALLAALVCLCTAGCPSDGKQLPRRRFTTEKPRSEPVRPADDKPSSPKHSSHEHPHGAHPHPRSPHHHHPHPHPHLAGGDGHHHPY